MLTPSSPVGDCVPLPSQENKRVEFALGLFVAKKCKQRWIIQFTKGCLLMVLLSVTAKLECVVADVCFFDGSGL